MMSMYFIRKHAGKWMMALIAGFALPAGAQTLNHKYPRTFIFHFDTAPADWYAKFDGVHGNVGVYEKAKLINPNLVRFNSRDWMIWGIRSITMPPEWAIRNSKGTVLSNDYGPRMDITDYCPKNAGVGNMRYNEWLIQETFQIMEDSRLDGYICQGVWDNPNVYDDVDLDRNGVNDYSEHGLDWVKARWQEGVHKVASAIYTELHRRGKLFILNSGFFHLFEWENANGLILEKAHSPTNFDWFLPIYQNWMTKAPQPHILYWEGRGQDKNSFRDMRYLLTYCLLGDGYFSFTEWDAGEHRYHKYYDEFDLDLGNPRSDAVQLSNGCYARFFENGVSLVNGTGYTQTTTAADLQAVTQYYDGPYYRFRGGQDPVWNDGSLFTSITIEGIRSDYSTEGGDGIILLKQPRTVVCDIIIDDIDIGTSPSSEPPQFIGNWTHGDQTGSEFWSVCERPYQNFFKFSYVFAGNGDSKAIYSPTITIPGNYEVFEWHGYMGNTPTHITESTNAPYTITYARSMAVSGTINQSVKYGQWNSLGVFYFEKGTAGNVTINNKADGIVMADAFKFVYRGDQVDATPPNAPTGLFSPTSTDNSISLQWTAPALASDGDGATAYQVFRNSTLVGTPLSTTFEDENLTENTAYSYQVYAVDDGANRSISAATGNFSTSSDRTPPVLSSATALGLTSLELQFSEPVDEASAEIGINYNIEPGITVFAAMLLQDTRKVRLTTSNHVIGVQYIVTARNIRDRATTPNTTTGSSATYTGYGGLIRIAVTGDDKYELYVNGALIGSGNTWYSAQSYSVSSIAGKNVIAVKCEDIVDNGGLLAEIEFNGVTYVTDDSWKANNTLVNNWNIVSFDDVGWQKATSYGLHGQAYPWAKYKNVDGITTTHGACWIWTSDAINDNTTYYRFTLRTSGDTTPPSPPHGIVVTKQ